MDSVEAHTMQLLGTVPASSMKSAAIHFRPGDVLYGRLRPYLNKVLAPDFEGLASAEFIPLTTPAGIAPRFVQYRINASDFVSFASGLDEGDRPRVDYTQIGAFEIELPPPGEQLRIVEAIESYLTRLDEAVATLDRVQRNLKRYRASVLKAAVEGRLVPTEAELARAEGREYEPASVLLERILAERRRRWEEAELTKMKAKGKVPKDNKWKAKYVEPVAPDTSELPELPEGWTWATIDQLLVSLDQGWSPQCHRRPVSAGEWGVIKTTAIQQMAYWEPENKALPPDLKPRAHLRVQSGDILVTRAGPRVRVGVCCLVRQVHRNLMLCDKVYRLRVDGAHVAPAYLETVLNSPQLLDKLERIKSGISDSGLNLTQAKFSTLAIPLPPRSEQDRVLLTVDKNLSMSDASRLDCDHSMSRLRQVGRSILKWAFEGRLVDQDPTDEPASVLLERIRAERETVAAKPQRRPRQTRKAAPKK
ncbi:MAG: hypothetical protein KJZ47_14050 [Gemmatimonadales bacterium]|nr:hypothetical protein [Gemmatimonadales bacterium]